MQTTKLKFDKICYLSDIENFELPNGIFNKTVTGIGGTTLAIECKYPYIIASPRVKLIENKAELYPECFVVKEGITKKDINSYIKQCISNNKAPKILTTFDSFYKIDVDKEHFRVLVDEMLILLSDASFKGFVNTEFLEQCSKYSYVTYMSATIDEEFLDNIDYFKNLDYYVLDIPTDKVKINHHVTSKPELAVIDLINLYLAGPYKDDYGNESNEVIFFINSVSTICSIIKEAKLKSNQVNIIVANNEENDELIKKLGEGFMNGRVPLKGEVSKMFTFCTSTAFCGCDFYSDNAMAVAMMNSRKYQTVLNPYDQLTLIAGRLRNVNNPFRKNLELIYDNNFSLLKSDEEFQKEEEAMERETFLNFKNYETVYSKEQFLKTWKGAYTSYNIIIDNKMIDNQLKRYYRKSQHKLEQQLKDGLLTNLIDKTSLIESGDILTHYNSNSFNNAIKRDNFQTEMKAYIEAMNDNNANEIARIASKFPKIVMYYNTLGAKKIASLKYVEKQIVKQMESYKKEHTVNYLNSIKKTFKLDTRYARTEVKEKLQNIYVSIGLKKTAKATDLFDYAECQEIRTKLNGKDIRFIVILNWKA